MFNKNLKLVFILLISVSILSFQSFDYMKKLKAYASKTKMRNGKGEWVDLDAYKEDCYIYFNTKENFFYLDDNPSDKFYIVKEYKKDVYESGDESVVYKNYDCKNRNKVDCEVTIGSVYKSDKTLKGNYFKITYKNIIYTYFFNYEE